MVIDARAGLVLGLPLLLGLIANAPAGLASAEAPRCLFVSSYARGNPWSDGIEQGLRSVLEGHCAIRRFDMDSKRRKSEAEKRARALRAKEIIGLWLPDIVITADDNAAKYLVAPYYRDAALPFVFCGVNWTVEEYGFPYANVTGMIEVAPIKPLLERAREIVPGARRLFYLGAATLTEHKNLERVSEIAAGIGLAVEHRLVDSRAGWLEAYREAQERDLVFIGNAKGIADWDPGAVQAAMLPITRRLSVTDHAPMMPFAILGMTRLGSEQGEWAGTAALSILSGTAPGEIPIVANRRRDIWVNTAIRRAAGIFLPDALLHKAKRMGLLGAAG